jgi:multiple sugar transport system substrate-binding protein
MGGVRVDGARFGGGDVLFFNDGPWRYQETFTKFRERDNWADDEVRMVPFPRDPNADRTFIRGKQDALMLVQGATNIEGFRAWTYSSLMAHQDPEMRAATRERDKQNHHWTDHQLDILEELRTPTDALTLVWDFKNGIGPTLSDPILDTPIERLTKRILVEDDTYTQVREEERGAILAGIAVMNDRVSGSG